MTSKSLQGRVNWIFISLVTFGQAIDNKDQKSLTRCLSMRNAGAVSWCPRKQCVVVLSIRKAEYIS